MLMLLHAIVLQSLIIIRVPLKFEILIFYTQSMLHTDVKLPISDILYQCSVWPIAESDSLLDLGHANTCR